MVTGGYVLGVVIFKVDEVLVGGLKTAVRDRRMSTSRCAVFGLYQSQEIFPVAPTRTNIILINRPRHNLNQIVNLVFPATPFRESYPRFPR